MNKNEEQNNEELELFLLRRTRLNSGGQLKMKLWKVTIRLSYYLKRMIDIVGSSCGILFLSPLLLTTALIIKFSSPGPIIFCQTRVGKNGRYFKFYKFRSMYTDAEERLAAIQAQNESADGVIFKMKNDPRITPIGRFIRKYSIDELPQLFNVLGGDMSLVGPRPPIPREVQQYTIEDYKRLSVIPGLTCIWQISGRSDIAFKEQMQLDIQYIQSQSVWKDLLILLKTIPAVLTGKGAY